MLLLLLLSYYCCFHITPVTSAFSGVAELTIQLLRLISILCVPLCRINKFGFYFPRRLLRSPILVGHQLIRHKGRLWFGNNARIHQKILQALHSSAIGGHSGFHATYNRIKHLFSWPGMKSDVKKFVAACNTCLRAKTERIPYPGLLEPLEVPKRA